MTDQKQRIEKIKSKSWVISRLWQPEMENKRALELNLGIITVLVGIRFEEKRGF